MPRLDWSTLLPRGWGRIGNVCILHEVCFLVLQVRWARLYWPARRMERAGIYNEGQSQQTLV
jgi:hypothetical protein